MAIEGATIVSRHILDDSELRAGLTRNEAMITASSQRMAVAIRDSSGRFVSSAKAMGDTADYTARSVQGMADVARVAEQRHSSLSGATRALGSTLHLVTGEAGFMAIEMARTGSHMARAISSTGGLTAAFKGLWAVMLANPLTLVLIALAAIAAKMYSIWSETSERIEEIKKQKKELDKEESKYVEASYKRTANLGRQRDVVLGRMSPEEARWKEVEQGISHLGPDAQAMARKEVQAEFDLVGAKAQKQRIADQWKESEDAEKAWSEKQTRIRDNLANEEIARRKMVNDALAAQSNAFFAKQEADGKAATLRAIADYEAMMTSRTAALQGAEIKLGISKPSDSITDPVEKRLAQFFENTDEQRKNLPKPAVFGIRDQSEFRFGMGAPGSTIGEQNEQKATTEAVKQLDKNLQASFTKAFGSNKTGWNMNVPGAIGP